MLRFLSLTTEYDKSIYVNPEKISYMRPLANSPLTLLQFTHTSEYERVKETPEQILALIERGEAS